MFTDDYILPGFHLVRQHQRILLHTLVFLITAGIGIALGTLVSLIPLVAGFTLSGISIGSITAAQAMNSISSDPIVLAGASATFVILVLNLFGWASFYLGGVIHETIDPKSQLVPAVQTAFSSIRTTLKPLLFLAFIASLLSTAGIAAGWGIWTVTNLSLAGSMFIFLASTASTLFLFVSSLAPLASNMDKKGVIDSIKTSFQAINKDPLNYLALLSTILVVNALVLLLPVFGVLITLITIPISIASLNGYYYLNSPKPEEAPKTKAAPRPVVAAVAAPSAPSQAPAASPALTPAASANPKPLQTPTSSSGQKNETDEDRTKRVLSKILKDL